MRPLSGDADWAAGLALLDAYVARVGDARPPRGHAERGLPLAAWLARQRRAARDGALGAARVRELEARGVEIAPPKAERRARSWAVHADALDAFRAREGHANLRRDFVDPVSSLELGRWLISQRVHARRGELDDAQRERLAALGALTA